MKRLMREGAVIRVPKKALLVLISLLCARSSMALDWRDPWLEPYDPVAAATSSDEYAWRIFVALNWPADTRARTADTAVPFGADQPTVWETWQSTGDVYLANGADPGPWAPGAEVRSADPERRFETFSLKDLRNVRHVVGGVMVPFVDSIATARRLTEIRMNRASFEFIRSRRLYSREGQIQDYASGDAVSFPYGAKEVKAKWRPISQSERSRYHTTLVTLADGTQRLYGLTALHIASKDLPNWLWATFEHVDNPKLPDNEGWQLPSRDSFACRQEAAECNRPPSGIGLEGTVWQYYRLRGTLTRYTDSEGRPQLLANSELEAGMQRTSSCITCHSRSTIGIVGDEPVRLAIFDTRDDGSPSDIFRLRGFLGAPRTEWFAGGAHGRNQPLFKQLDFVWSLAKAQ